MVKVLDVLNAIDEFAPFNTQLDFDNSGLLVGDLGDSVTKVAVALDATEQTINKTAELGCQLLVTHHPIIFSPLKSISSNDLAYVAVKKGVAVISAHTNLDASVGGVNDCLAKAIELKDVSPLSGSGHFPMGRIGKISAVSAQSFGRHLRNCLNCNGIRFVDNGRSIAKVAVCGGAGGDFIEAAYQNNADAFVTGECKYHERLLASKLGISLFECGHFATEQVVKRNLADVIGRIGVTTVLIDEKDPANYI